MLNHNCVISNHMYAYRRVLDKLDRKLMFVCNTTTEVNLVNNCS